MEIGNETGGPCHDHIWIAGASAGSGDLGDSVSAKSSSLSLCGGLVDPDESHSEPLNYIWTVNLGKEHQVKCFGSGSLSQ